MRSMLLKASDRAMNGLDDYTRKYIPYALAFCCGYFAAVILQIIIWRWCL